MNALCAIHTKRRDERTDNEIDPWSWRQYPLTSAPNSARIKSKLGSNGSVLGTRNTIWKTLKRCCLTKKPCAETVVSLVRLHTHRDRVVLVVSNCRSDQQKMLRDPLLRLRETSAVYV